MAKRIETPKYPVLRDMSGSSYPFTVGATHSKLKYLHDDILSASRMNARAMRAKLHAIAAEIRSHVEWLNRETAEVEEQERSRET